MNRVRRKSLQDIMEQLESLKDEMEGLLEEEEEYLEAGEADSLSHKYDDYDIGRMLVQRYPSMHTTGITIQI